MSAGHVLQERYQASTGRVHHRAWNHHSSQTLLRGPVRGRHDLSVGSVSIILRSPCRIGFKFSFTPFILKNAFDTLIVSMGPDLTNRSFGFRSDFKPSHSPCQMTSATEEWVKFLIWHVSFLKLFLLLA